MKGNGLVGDYILEWSFSQKCFHIEPVIESIMTNLSMFLYGGGTDYVIMGIFRTYEDAAEKAEQLRKQIPNNFSIEREPEGEGR